MVVVVIVDIVLFFVIVDVVVIVVGVVVIVVVVLIVGVVCMMLFGVGDVFVVVALISVCFVSELTPSATDLPNSSAMPHTQFVPQLHFRGKHGDLYWQYPYDAAIPVCIDTLEKCAQKKK